MQVANNTNTVSAAQHSKHIFSQWEVNSQKCKPCPTGGTKPYVESTSGGL